MAVVDQLEQRSPSAQKFVIKSDQDEDSEEYIPDHQDHNATKLLQLQFSLKEIALIRDCDFISESERIAAGGDPNNLVLSSLFCRMPEYLVVVSMLPREYEYSDHLNVFIKCCDALDLRQKQENCNLLETQENDTPFAWRVPGKLFSNLIKMLHHEFKSERFNYRLLLRKKEARHRYREYCAYVDSLFNHRDRLVVIRIDLTYRKEIAPGVSLDQALADLDRMLANRRTNGIFDHLEVYIVKAEYGIGRRLHFHGIFFFNGSERQGRSHSFIAKEIGEYWSRVITKGRGRYWNCNQRASDFDELGRRGIGLIHWNDADLRNNLQRFVLTYVCKTDQCFRSKSQPKAKLIRRGLKPANFVVRPGRRRRFTDTCPIARILPRFNLNAID